MEDEAKPTNEQIRQACEAADNYRRRAAQAMSPGQRMELFEQIQSQAFATLRSNPDAYAAFLRRNHHKRRQSNVRRLELELLGRVDRASDE